MKCPICGFQNKTGVKLCEKCLATLDVFKINIEEEGIFCSNGHWNPSGVKYCTVCGKPIETTPTISSPYLLVEEGSGELLCLPVEENPTRLVIGRKGGDFSPDVDLSKFTNSLTVSRKHAAITIDPATDSIFIEDLGSTNGTFLNGMRLEPNKKYKVEPGDVLSFSKKLHLIFEVKKK